MRKFTVIAAILVAAMISWVAGDYYGTTHARDLSGFVGSLIGALLAGLIAPWVVIFQARHQRQTGKAIILDLLEIVSRALANLDAAKANRPWPFPNPNSAAGELDSIPRFLRQVESVCADLQSTVPGAAAVRMIVREEEPRLKILEEIGRSLLKFERKGSLLDPTAIDKIVFDPNVVAAISDIRESLATVENHLTSGVAERHMKF